MEFAKLVLLCLNYPQQGTGECSGWFDNCVFTYKCQGSHLPLTFGVVVIFGRQPKRRCRQIASVCVISLLINWYKMHALPRLSKVVATFNHVGGSFNLFMTTTRDVWIIPSCRIWDYVLLVVHISCIITNCGQHQRVIPSPLSIALKALLEENTLLIFFFCSMLLYFSQGTS